MIAAIHAAQWPGPFGYFYRGLLDNALADPFGGLVTLILVSVIIKGGRRWWVRLAKRLWAKHGHHVHNARDWWHAPVHARLAALEESHRRIHEKLGIPKGDG